MEKIEHRVASADQPITIEHWAASAGPRQTVGPLPRPRPRPRRNAITVWGCSWEGNELQSWV
jgi:hypothetical protein